VAGVICAVHSGQRCAATGMLIVHWGQSLVVAAWFRSAFAAWLSRRLGEERVLLAAAAVLTCGLLLRGLWPGAMLFPGTVLASSAIAVMNIRAVRGPIPDKSLTAPCQRLYLLAGLLVCGGCGRRMESAWSNGKPAYRCRHGHTTASTPGPDRAKNAYIREDRILPHLPALHLRLTGYATPQRRQRTRRGLDVRHRASPEDVIRYLRERQITLTYAPASGALIAGTAETAQTITLTAS
jgi:hypothetical protein